MSRETVSKSNDKLVDNGERKGWVRRNRGKLAIGLATSSVAVTMLLNPLEETVDGIEDAAPWVASGVVASELMFVAGAATMVGSVGEKIGNPFTVKERIPEIAQKAGDSALFKAGFVVNTIGAVGDFAVISTGVVKEMPVESWGVLSLTLLDLGVTVAVRSAMIGSIGDNRTQPADN